MYNEYYIEVDLMLARLTLCICDPLRENQPYAKNLLLFFNAFCNIFAASIVVANLKWISCSLTELRLLFMPFFE